MARHAIRVRVLVAVFPAQGCHSGPPAGGSSAPRARAGSQHAMRMARHPARLNSAETGTKAQAAIEGKREPRCVELDGLHLGMRRFDVCSRLLPKRAADAAAKPERMHEHHAEHRRGEHEQETDGLRAHEGAGGKGGLAQLQGQRLRRGFGKKERDGRRCPAFTGEACEALAHQGGKSIGIGLARRALQRAGVGRGRARVRRHDRDRRRIGNLCLRRRR